MKSTKRETIMPRRPHGKRSSFGAWLLLLRKRAGLSQREVAIRIAENCDHDPGTSSVSKWERKGELGGASVLPAYASALGVSLETLLRVYQTPTGYESLPFSQDEIRYLHTFGATVPGRELSHVPDFFQRMAYESSLSQQSNLKSWSLSFPCNLPHLG